MQSQPLISSKSSSATHLFDHLWTCRQTVSMFQCFHSKYQLNNIPRLPYLPTAPPVLHPLQCSVPVSHCYLTTGSAAVWEWGLQWSRLAGHWQRGNVTAGIMEAEACGRELGSRAAADRGLYKQHMSEYRPGETQIFAERPGSEAAS